MKIATGERILTTVWIGSLWTIGYIVAPTLFQVLEDNALAGMVAGRLFTIENYIGLVCATVLIISHIMLAPHGQRLNWRLGVLLSMVGIIVVSQFVIHPMMVAVKAQGDVQGLDLGRLHGLSSVLYLINSLLGLVWVVLYGWNQLDKYDSA